ncbi:hypothetical protein H5410_038907 [Solanum commersonii]|uniref:Uncharacterized protein n=1 Tax=Solanum commersonii TaxID=4109 RepID=A0A9J5YAC4_SOLCO|nr:hypothetical protein H5410_038907 [Solanum commersonii]
MEETSKVVSENDIYISCFFMDKSATPAGLAIRITVDGKLEEGHWSRGEEEELGEDEEELGEEEEEESHWSRGGAWGGAKRSLGMRVTGAGGRQRSLGRRRLEVKRRHLKERNDEKNLRELLQQAKTTRLLAIELFEGIEALLCRRVRFALHEKSTSSQLKQQPLT